MGLINPDPPRALTTVDMKNPTKKLRNGPVIEIDPQIIRWRERLRKEGRALGRHMRKDREQQDRRKAARHDDAAIERGAKKFFK